jgi:hypothetical protein
MMSGHDIFERIMADVTRVINNDIDRKITLAEFDEWQRQASFDIMKGARYGQSFCNHFGLTDNILYYEFSWLNADAYIRRVYIDKP